MEADGVHPEELDALLRKNIGSTRSTISPYHWAFGGLSFCTCLSQQRKKGLSGGFFVHKLSDGPMLSVGIGPRPSIESLISCRLRTSVKVLLMNCCPGQC
jgi:hypothetical protein